MHIVRATTSCHAWVSPANGWHLAWPRIRESKICVITPPRHAGRVIEISFSGHDQDYSCWRLYYSLASSCTNITATFPAPISELRLKDSSNSEPFGTTYPRSRRYRSSHNVPKLRMNGFLGQYAHY